MPNNHQDHHHKKTSSLKTIGWREIISLPQLKIDRVKAKIDTGARSSALHAFDIEDFTDNGKSMIRFRVHPRQHNSKITVTSQAELLEYREVKNSGGKVELRPVIETEIILKKQKWSIELTLTNRKLMGFRMLLGREAIRNKFLVDPGRSYLQSERKDHNSK